MDSALIFKASPKKAVKLLLFSIALVALGAWLTTDKRWLGWFCVVFFGLGVPASLVMMRPGTTYLRLDAQGFEIVAMARRSLTRWTEVDAFRMASIHGYKMIAIEYSLDCTRQRTGRVMASALAGMEGAIADHYSAPIEEILEALNAWRARHGQGAI